MTTMELNAMKAEFIKDFLNEENETLVRKFIASFRKEKRQGMKPPCQFTIEELKKEVAQGVKDYKAGDVCTIEELRAKHPRV